METFPLEPSMVAKHPKDIGINDDKLFGKKWKNQTIFEINSMIWQAKKIWCLLLYKFCFIFEKETLVEVPHNFESLTISPEFVRF